jgi:DNA-binding NtrC family response regulator
MLVPCSTASIALETDRCNIASVSPLACGRSSLDPHEPPQAQSSDLSGLCVLVVDDSWHVSSGLKLLLESMGADVIGPAATVADAERMVSERRPDVALVDINLRHGERSYGLIDRLCDQGIRVIVITGYTEPALPKGKAAAILQKPLRGDVLLANLRPRAE